MNLLCACNTFWRTLGLARSMLRLKQQQETAERRIRVVETGQGRCSPAAVTVRGDARYPRITCLDHSLFPFPFPEQRDLATNGNFNLFNSLRAHSPTLHLNHYHCIVREYVFYVSALARWKCPTAYDTVASPRLLPLTRTRSATGPRTSVCPPYFAMRTATLIT